MEWDRPSVKRRSPARVRASLVDDADGFLAVLRFERVVAHRADKTVPKSDGSLPRTLNPLVAKGRLVESDIDL